MQEIPLAINPTLHWSVKSYRDLIKAHISDFEEVKKLITKSIAEEYDQEELNELLQHEDALVEFMACAYTGAFKTTVHLMNLMLWEIGTTETGLPEEFERLAVTIRCCFMDAMRTIRLSDDNEE